MAEIEQSQLPTEDAPQQEESAPPPVLDRNAKLALARVKALEVRRANAEAKKRAINLVKQESELKQLNLKKREEEVEKELQRARTVIEKTNTHHLLEDKPPVDPEAEKEVFKKPSKRKPKKVEVVPSSDEESDYEESQPQPPKKKAHMQPRNVEYRPQSVHAPTYRYGSVSTEPVFRSTYDNHVLGAYHAQIAKHKQQVLFRNMLGF